jgi:hypothetical protein
MIPKIIYHLWLSNKEENELQKKCVESWNKLGFEIKHITLENVDRSSKFVQEALSLNSPKGWVKANDYLRIQYLYENGGVYMDNDVEVLKSFDDLMTGCFLGMENNAKVNLPNLVNMAVIGAEKGCWLLKEWLDECNKFRGDGPEKPTFTLVLMTKILKKYGWNSKYFEYNGVKVFENNVFYPKHWSDKITYLTDESRTIHHFLNSWS